MSDACHTCGANLIRKIAAFDKKTELLVWSIVVNEEAVRELSAYLDLDPYDGCVVLPYDLASEEALGAAERLGGFQREENLDYELRTYDGDYG
ncbi:hypothetical protein FHX37_2812 [Haloactinospora alba]|uniref:DUF7683 domain-containing protein n=1 Tax=Haloactinospora alba TaxID=405555 RepID=A0A543NLW6_9ACTN|nr:hypothetical protein [Haloactinospora alba]TQN32828.1 hypothetical protein FHX37_2812 [Haloactinospora alba]